MSLVIEKLLEVCRSKTQIIDSKSSNFREIMSIWRSWSRLKPSKLMLLRIKEIWMLNSFCNKSKLLHELRENTQKGITPLKCKSCSNSWRNIKMIKRKSLSSCSKSKMNQVLFMEKFHNSYQSSTLNWERWSIMAIKSLMKFYWNKSNYSKIDC